MFLENDIDSLLRGLHCDARSKRCCPRRLVCRTRPSMRRCRMRRKRNATPRWRRCNRSRCKPKPLQTARSRCKPPACGGESGLRHTGRYALHQAIGSLLEDYSLVSFVPLDISTVRRCLPLWR